jgi:hypothetical protein
MRRVRQLRASLCGENAKPRSSVTVPDPTAEAGYREIVARSAR